MMEARKRPHTEDKDGPVVKKRALSSALDSPVPMTPTLDSQPAEPGDDEPLTNFQKVAIYRRMRHYAGEHQRGQSRIEQLERRRRACEAELAAIDASWSQMIEVVGSLLNPEAVQASQGQDEEMFDEDAHLTPEAPPELVQSLRERMRLTQKLVAAFVRSAGQAQPSASELHKKCQTTQAECSSLRSELKLTQSRLEDVEKERDSCQDLLHAAETRAIREATKDLISKRSPSEQKSSEVKEEAKDEEKAPLTVLSPKLPQERILVNGVHGDHVLAVDDSAAVDRELAETREKRIQELEKEVMDLNTRLNAKKSLTDEEIEATPRYKALQAEVSLQLHEAQSAKAEHGNLQKELDKLKTGRADWEREFIEQTTKEHEETKSMLKKRDQENARLREQRDQQTAEITERKTRSQVKQTAHEEAHRLAASRAERIVVLESENKRLKTRLAATSGDEDLFAFLSKDDSQTTSYVEDLRSRFADVQAKHDALNAVVSKLQQEQPDVAGLVEAEAAAKLEVAGLKKQLSQCRDIVGIDSTSSEDLRKHLEVKEEELRLLRLKDKQREEAEHAMYVELDKLSSAWEALDKQVKSRIFDLSAMEERLTKSALEKAKADNKFYAAMRDKEACELERKNAMRNIEKQDRVIENLTRSEKTLSAIVANLEKENTMHNRTIAQYKLEFDKYELTIMNMKKRIEAKDKEAAEMQQHWETREKQTHARRVELRKLQEEHMKMKKEADRLSEKLKHEIDTRVHSDGEAQLQAELDKCMRLLKCSTCNHAMRSTCITKCMHTFCKACVDARLHHRQRKCPACNVQFAQSEVQQIFFQ